MATRTLRRGLPRVPGGEPWPPGGIAVDVDGPDADDGSDATGDTRAGAAPSGVPPASGDLATDATETGATATATAATPTATATAATPTATASPVTRGADEGAVASASVAAPAPALRRGLPRTPGGEPWPPADARPASVQQAADASPPASTPVAAEPSAAVPGVASNPSAPSSAPQPDAAPAANPTPVDADPTPGVGGSVRRGLPRVAGGEPWPPAGTVPLASVARSAPADTDADTAAAPIAAAKATATAVVATRTAPALGDPSTPLSAPRTVWNGSAPRHITATAPESARPRPGWTQAIAALLGAAALAILAAAAVAFVRALLSFPFMQDFLTAFPGEYEPAVAVEPGFAPWVNWAHFFNVFLMVLIIRSGLRIRNEKRPTAFWTPRNDPKGKVSLTIWFHQALDILWLVNGVIFVVLLFVTGHWARIVPTSWEVIPNALSAALQYVSFDWPTEHGWVNYNSLQQLAYFVTVFIAAPLAAATGFRMSGMWPKRAERLSKAYPIEWARALHFPVMIYFVVFIIGHVALVFLTGFLRNLNHMYASSDAVGWTGFWVFVASVVVIALGWVAARPLVIAPIAKLFGSVSGR